ncbi:hypothetical protein [Singulisphaera sp. PoT]|uniref:hypothetical protein n=1 Tax=Singulisphaera sp. PoT TaxID=3411797 RepID=UPI003BF5E361
MSRFRLRTMMLIPVVLATIFASIRPAREWYRGSAWHLEQIETVKSREARLRLEVDQLQFIARNRVLVAILLSKSQEFLLKSDVEKERAIDEGIRHFRRRIQNLGELIATYAQYRRRIRPGVFWGTSDEYKMIIESDARMRPGQ